MAPPFCMDVRDADYLHELDSKRRSSATFEATPVLEGAAAQRLFTQLENVCSPAVAQARIDWAKQELASFAQIDKERTL
jgi:hypothetical protein